MIPVLTVPLYRTEKKRSGTVGTVGTAFKDCQSIKNKTILWPNFMDTLVTMMKGRMMPRRTNLKKRLSWSRTYYPLLEL